MIVQLVIFDVTDSPIHVAKIHDLNQTFKIQ